MTLDWQMASAAAVALFTGGLLVVAFLQTRILRRQTAILGGRAAFEIIHVPAMWRTHAPPGPDGKPRWSRDVFIEAHIANKGLRDSAIQKFRIEFREVARPHIPPARFEALDIHPRGDDGSPGGSFTVRVGERRVVCIDARVVPPTGFFDGRWECDLVGVPVSGAESPPMRITMQWPTPDEQGVPGWSPFL